jgi:hypothetical protein
MNRKQPPPVWPYVLVLATLFALNAFAPRRWQHGAPGNRETVRTVGNSAANSLKIAGVERNLKSSAPADNASSERMLSDTDLFLRPRIDPDLITSSTELRPLNDRAGEINSAELSPPADSVETDSSTCSPDDALSPVLEAPAITEEPSLAEVAPHAAVAEAAPAVTKPNAACATRPGQRRAITARRLKTTVRPEQPNLWGEPTALVDQLDRLSAECDSGDWATRVADLIRQLCRADDAHSPRALLSLQRLRDLADANHPLLVIGERTAKKGELRRLRYAVLRRLDLWELVPDLAETVSDARPSSSQTVSLSTRPNRTSFTSAKLAKLLGDLERYEQTGLSDDGRDLAADVSEISTSDDELTARTQRWLEWNYRNANLRIVLSSDLLNRLVPQQKPVEEPVHDRILGVPTRGWSTSSARVAIRLIPDPQAVRFLLEAKGVVVARTTSRRDPVTVYSNSDSAFLARKQLELSAAGLKAWPTQAEVSNSSRLRDIETDFDDVPLLGPIVEGIARAKHAETEPAVRRVARRKVAARVQQEIDLALEPKLRQARQLYQQRVLTPLDGLALVPSVIELQTSEARLTSRLRLAGEEQLAASTPRPMALGDSLASVQIHQSLINNICDRLNVDGQQFTLPELQQRLMEAFKLPPESFPEEYPTDLRITFAKRDAVTARFDEGRIELTLGIAELHKFPKKWRDFQVRVYYRPKVSGIDVRFVRDGTVQLRGEHFGREPQIALRGIFSKVFSHDRDLMFVDPRVVNDPRVAGLRITQCVLTDGWIGLSLGHASSATQARRTVNPLY